MRPLRPIITAVFVALTVGAARASSMSVDSSAFWNGGAIPPFDSASTMGCRGRNISPPLRITGVPPDARSLAVTLVDSDAPVKAGFVHWVAYGIDPRTPSLVSGFGSKPGPYVRGHNDAGTDEYFGPCPPPGDPPHHYTFSIYALALDPARLPAGLTRAQLLHAIAAHTLAVATLTGTFGR
jgi:Raf kinase inhibitor-like YbhB/YbcL family protein